MFNSLDNCKSWPAKRTAKLIYKIENSGEKFEFTNNYGIVILQNKTTGEPYGMFFDSKVKCKNHVK